MSVTMLHCDCMEYMAGLEDKAFELAIVDPPYGIGIETSGTWMRAHGFHKWDKSTPTKEYFYHLFRVSKNQIIWGGNYFTKYLYPNNNWIIWHKMNDGVSFSMAEMAWTNIKKNIKIVTLFNNGAIKNHICEKPVALYKWLLSRYAKPGDKILDTHGGSGSICIACHDLGYDLTWMELDADYYKAACERYKNHAAQGNLFDQATLTAQSLKQEDLSWT